MMGYLSMLVFIMAAVIMFAATSSGTCPPKHMVLNKEPSCFSDADCLKYGQACCPNDYNTKSCAGRAYNSGHGSRNNPKYKNTYARGSSNRRYQ